MEPRWAYRPTPEDDLKMRRELRRGDYKTLNLYYVLDIDGSHPSFCPYPSSTIELGSNDYFMDGCTMISATMPGGSAVNYNMGMTTVHEVGHWFGLFHTFDGGCSALGDYVDDTPAEAQPNFGCDKVVDSCPGSVGVDPVHNYVDYVYE